VRCSKTTWSPGAVSAEITAIAPACTPSVGMMVSGAGEAIAGQPFAAGGKPMVGKTRRIAGQPLRIFARGLGQQFGDDYALADIRRARQIETNLVGRGVDQAGAVDTRGRIVGRHELRSRLSRQH
jgi:hypothetical protein